MVEKNRWDTEAYISHIEELTRTELCKLYPSETWSLYRIILLCKNVLDLGCGDGAKALAVKKNL